MGSLANDRCSKRSCDTVYDTGLVQQMGESSTDRILPQSGSLLELPDLPVYPLHVKRNNVNDGLIVRLYNSSDEVVDTSIVSSLFTVTRAWMCDLFEHQTESLAVDDGRLALKLTPRAVTVVALQGVLHTEV